MCTHMTKLINCFLTCSGLGQALILCCKDGVSTVPKQSLKLNVKNQLHLLSRQKNAFIGSICMS